MALRDTVVDSYFIQTKHRAMQEVLYLNFTGSSTTVQRRTRTIVDGEWVLLSATAAQNFVDTHAGDTDSIYTAVEVNRYCGDGAWKVQRHIDSRGAWVVDT